jgi:RimJ/RimL family protein N-acetyltransferase
LRIKKDNIVLRSAVLKDAPLLNAWWNDGAVMAHAGFPNGLGQSLEETKEAIRRNEGKLSQLCIIEIDGNPVGEMSFRIGKNEANPGWKICDTAYQNKGYGRQIIRMTFDYLFGDPALNQAMPIHRVFWDTNLSNTRAQHVYELLGARRVGVRENCWTDQLGRPQSAVDYELTREMHEKQQEEGEA